MKQTKVIMLDPRVRFKLNWNSPYLVRQILPKGTSKRNEFIEAHHLDHLKKYYLKKIEKKKKIKK